MISCIDFCLLQIQVADSKVENINLEENPASEEDCGDQESNHDHDHDDDHDHDHDHDDYDDVDDDNNDNDDDHVDDDDDDDDDDNSSSDDCMNEYEKRKNSTTIAGVSMYMSYFNL